MPCPTIYFFSLVLMHDKHFCTRTFGKDGKTWLQQFFLDPIQFWTDWHKRQEDGAKRQLRRPGIEPGSTAWKAAMLTTIPPTRPTWSLAAGFNSSARCHNATTSSQQQRALATATPIMTLSWMADLDGMSYSILPSTWHARTLRLCLIVQLGNSEFLKNVSCKLGRR